MRACLGSRRRRRLEMRQLVGCERGGREVGGRQGQVRVGRQGRRARRDERVLRAPARPRGRRPALRLLLELAHDPRAAWARREEVELACSAAPKVGMRPTRVLARDAAFQVEARAKLGDGHPLEAVDLRTRDWVSHGGWATEASRRRTFSWPGDGSGSIRQCQ